MESELFGYEKGAFTGAAHRRIGKVEQADKGTIFLDEIGDMPVTIQAKILRLLQERSIERLGGRETIPVDVRIIAATNRDLETALTEGRVPRRPLLPSQGRHHLACHPCATARATSACSANIFSQATPSKTRLKIRASLKKPSKSSLTYPWPGNVRELANTIQKALIFNRGAPISAEDIGTAIDSDKKVWRNYRKDGGEELLRKVARQRITEGIKTDNCLKPYGSICQNHHGRGAGGDRR